MTKEEQNRMTCKLRDISFILSSKLIYEIAPAGGAVTAADKLSMIQGILHGRTIAEAAIGLEIAL